MKTPRTNYSREELKAANLTSDVIRKNNIFVDKKRKTCKPERVEELKKMKLTSKKPSTSVKPKKAAPKPKAEKVKEAPKVIKKEVKVEKPIDKPTPKTKVEKEPSPASTAKTSVKSSLPEKVEKAVKNIFELEEIYGKKEDLLNALEEHVVPVANMTVNKLFDTLKNEEIIIYSRSAPRGWRAN